MTATKKQLIVSGKNGVVPPSNYSISTPPPSLPPPQVKASQLLEAPPTSNNPPSFLIIKGVPSKSTIKRLAQHKDTDCPGN